MRMFQRGAVVALATALLALAGCAQSYKPGEAYFIDEVNVTKASPTIGNAELTSQVRGGITRYTSVQPKEGAPKRLDVQVTGFRVKNPAISLLVGDANRMSANATITGADGTVEWTQPITVQTDAALNGPIGAIVAAARKADGVQLQLSERMADRISRLAYGGKLPERHAVTAPQRQTIRTVPDAPASAAPPQTAPATQPGLATGV